MATDTYPKDTLIRLTEEEHEAFTDEADKRDMSVSRFLAMGGQLALGQDIEDFLAARQAMEEQRAEQARRETEALEKLGYRVRLIANTLCAILDQLRDGEEVSIPTLEETADKADGLCDELVARIAKHYR